MSDSAAADPPPLSPNPLDELRINLRRAFAFLTRLPIAAGFVAGAESDAPELARSMPMFPLVGAAVGAIGALVYMIAHWLLPPLLAAPLALAATILVTGGLHEDGLSDCADGLYGGHDRESRLAIMRDSRIGAYGAIALGLTLILRGGSLAALGNVREVAGALIAAHALGRAAIVPVMLMLTPARADGLGAGAGMPTQGEAGMAVILALIIAALSLPIGMALSAVIGAALAAIAVAFFSRAMIGGYTGDVLGAVEQGAETFALLAMVAAA